MKRETITSSRSVVRLVRPLSASVGEHRAEPDDPADHLSVVGADLLGGLDGGEHPSVGA